MATPRSLPANESARRQPSLLESNWRPSLTEAVNRDHNYTYLCSSIIKIHLFKLFMTSRLFSSHQHVTSPNVITTVTIFITVSRVALRVETRYRTVFWLLIVVVVKSDHIAPTIRLFFGILNFARHWAVTDAGMLATCLIGNLLWV